MLKRTDHKRASMKRIKSDESESRPSSFPPQFNDKISNTSVIYQSGNKFNSKNEAPVNNKNSSNRTASVKYKAPTPTKVELVPGLFVEGEEVDL